MTPTRKKLTTRRSRKVSRKSRGRKRVSRHRKSSGRKRVGRTRKASRKSSGSKSIRKSSGSKRVSHPRKSTRKSSDRKRKLSHKSSNKYNYIQKVINLAEKMNFFLKMTDLKPGKCYNIYTSIDQGLLTLQKICIINNDGKEAETDLYSFYKYKGLATLGTGADRNILKKNYDKIKKLL